MATDREQDILGLIQENPLISQQEIADRCGITRSSVAVHISNLMKKGLIEGKGYILSTGSYAAVIGGANMDIGGRSASTLIPHDSNPGVVSFSPGGVGRNIAHNMGLLDCDVRFISVFGGDSSGAELIESCRRAGVDTGNSLVLENGRTAVYLYVNNEDGEMAVALNDMAIYEHMTPEFLALRMDFINKSAVCVADTNSPAQTLAYLAQNCKVPLIIDPVSTVKALRIKELLPFIHTLKCNRIEAEVLSGVSISDNSTLERAVKTLLDSGVKQVVVTMGGEGALCASSEGFARLPACRAQVVNVTGGGDAFTAALAKGIMEEKPLADAARAGLAAGALAVSHINTIHPDMSVQHIEQIVQSGAVE